MAAANSIDLRTRVLRDADAGLTSNELAERYHVSLTDATLAELRDALQTAAGLTTIWRPSSSSTSRSKKTVHADEATTARRRR
jgi:hypothetical protein